MNSTELPEPRQTVHGKVRAEAFESDALPASTEIVVIGGGIMGVSVAYWLALRGVPVTVVEKGEINGESSGRSFGLISELLLDADKLEMTGVAKQGWATLQQEAGETGYRRHGVTFLAATDQELAFFAGWLQSIQGPARAAASLLTAKQVAERYPGGSNTWAGGITSTTDGAAEPRLAAIAVAKKARELGARFVTQCAARTLELTNRRVDAVITERGPIRARAVVLAGYAWNRLFCGNLGIDLPQLYLFETISRTNAVPDGPAGMAGVFQGAFRRQIDGSYTIASNVGLTVPLTRDFLKLLPRFIPAIRTRIGTARLSLNADARRDWTYARRWRGDQISPFERTRVLDPIVDVKMPHAAWQNTRRNFPFLNDAERVEMWAGAIVVPPDNMPVLSGVEQISGFYLACSGGYGFTAAPALAHAAADLITDAAPPFNLHPYRFSRFSDGSKLNFRG